jgi:hypothetical protein
MHEVYSGSESLEALPRQAKSLLVAVDADKHESGEAGEKCFGMTAEPERRVNEDGACRAECRSEQFDAACQKYRGVKRGVDHE